MKWVWVFLRTVNFFYEKFNDISCSEYLLISQPTVTCSKLTIENLDQGVKYVQSKQ